MEHQVLIERIEAILHNPTGVSATELTALRDELAAESAEEEGDEVV